MKEVEKPYVKRYHAMRLYKDDLEKIVNIFESHFQDNIIVVDKYELANISDIDKIKKKTVTKFSIKHHHRYPQETPYRTELLSLDLDHDKARLYLSNDADTYLLGIAAQIDTFLSKRKNIVGFLTSPITSILEVVIFMVLFSILNNTPWRYADHSFHSILLMTLTFVLLIAAILWAIWTIYIQNWRYTLIYLTDSILKTNFFSRNRDQIILALTVGIFTAVITGVLTTLIINTLLHTKP